jgi:hypothetical protein
VSGWVGVTDELGLFTPAADSSCWYSKDGAVGRRILAGTVLGAHARVGLGVCVGISDAIFRIIRAVRGPQLEQSSTLCRKM